MCRAAGEGTYAEHTIQGKTHMRSWLGAVLVIMLAFSAQRSTAQPFWSPASGIWVGKVVQFTSARDGSVIAAGSPGVFRSTDHGLSWQSTDLTSFMTQFAVDTSGRIFAGTRLGGMYCSVDQGHHWKTITEGLSSLEVTRLEACHDGTVLAIMKDGLYRINGGDSVWTLVDTTIVTAGAVFVRSNSAGTLFAASIEGKLFTSITGGSHWTPTDTGNKYWDFRALFIDRNDNLFKSIGGFGISRSTDGGSTWHTVHATDAGIFAEGPTGTLFAGTGSGVIRSIDSGKTWVRIPSEAGPSVSALIAAHNGVVLWSGLDTEVFRSTDNGATYTPQYPGPGGQVISCLAADKNGVIFAGAFALGVFRSMDGGTSWMQSDAGMTNRAVNAVAVGPGQLRLAATQQGLFMSSDNGDTWARRDSGMNPLWTNDLLLSPAGTFFAATTGGGVFTSTNNGAVWTQSGAGVLPAEIRKLRLGTDGTLYVAGHPGGVYGSTDDGAHWTYLTGGPRKYEYVRGLATGPQRRLAALTLDSLRLSSDGGDTWSTIVTPTGQQIWDVYLDRSASLFLSVTDGRVYRSTDDGSTWTQFHAGLPEGGTLVSDFLQNESGYLYAATQFGVYRTVRVTTGIEQQPPLVPDAVRLLSGYPNPFNGATRIRFMLPHKAQVSLTVFNTLGQRVAILAEGPREPGAHEVVFDAASLPSGTYYYRLRVDGSYLVGRALLLK